MIAVATRRGYSPVMQAADLLDVVNGHCGGVRGAQPVSRRQTAALRRGACATTNASAAACQHWGRSCMTDCASCSGNPRLPRPVADGERFRR